MERGLDIPPPIVKENEAEYLIELAKIKESDEWIKKHSVENKSNTSENKIVQNQQINDKELFMEFFEALIVILGPIIVLFSLPLLAAILLGFILYELGGFHAFPFG